MQDTTPEPYGGPERRDNTTRSRFNAAVAEAAREGAALALAERRPRLIAMVTGTAASIALIFLVIWWLAIARPYATANALYDCRLFTHAAALLSDSTMQQGQFVSSDANLRERQNRQGISGELGRDFEKIIRAKTLLRISAQQHADVARTIGEWRRNAIAVDRDATLLANLAGTDCVRRLGG